MNDHEVCDIVLFYTKETAKKRHKKGHDVTVCILHNFMLNDRYSDKALYDHFGKGGI